MPNGTLPDPAPIRRDQLSRAFKDQDLIRKIERLFKVAGELTPRDVEGITVSVQEVRSIQETVNEVVNQLQSLESSTIIIAEVKSTLSTAIGALQEITASLQDDTELRERVYDLEKRNQELQISLSENSEIKSRLSELEKKIEGLEISI